MTMRTLAVTGRILMATTMIAGAGLGLVAAGSANAQQRVVAHGPGAGYPMPGTAPMAPRVGVVRPPVITPGPVRPGPGGRPHGPRWGSKIGGHWWGGVNAPGGWNAYRRPHRGWVVPNYWISPRFYIDDWQGYGLSQPPYGYNWLRYYDDAVLIDSRGSIYDTVEGLDWDRDDVADGAYATDDAQVYATPADRGGYDDRSYGDRGYDDHGQARRSDGVGGTVAGAVVGGVAGNVIAGRGNRLGGTLIGAGVGAAAGYAVDRGADRHRGRVPVAPDRAPPPPPGYAPPPPMAYAPPPPPRPLPPHERPDWVSADGRTTVTTTSGDGYARGGYYYPGTTTTTVVVQTAPVVTTTTTEIYEDAVTYTRRPVTKRVKRVWRPRPAPHCACR
jgi:hypothetical protein